MKYIKLSILISFLTIAFSCERDFSSEGLTEGLIRYPSITLNDGPSQVLMVNEGSYEELGAVALLGTDDISDRIVITGVEDIDTSVPNVYYVNYAVTVTDELGRELTVNETRFVLVVTEDVSLTDLSGDYIGTGFADNPRTVPVTKVDDGLYTIPDVLSSSNGIAATFAHLGGDVLQIPNQPGPFGDVNTTSEGTSANLTENGFIWNVYIDCCGVFGPIDFVRQ